MQAPSRLATTTALVLASLFAACAPGSSAPPGGTPGPSILPGPTGGGTLTAGEVRLLLIDRFGALWYCDRDEYPVGRDELASMREQWPQVIADADLASAMQERLELPPLTDANLTDEQRLLAYRLWKVVQAIQLDPIGEGRYRFDYLARPVGGAAEGTRSAGIVTSAGVITVEQQAAAGQPMCPICLARGTRIDTPNGPINVEDLRLGDPIWTLDADGRLVAGTMIALGSTAAPANHQVIRLTLADGRSVTASPGHPLADGRTLESLAIGDPVDGSVVAGLELLPYAGGSTFDLVASGATGTYFSDGIPLGSTLAQAR